MRFKKRRAIKSFSKEFVGVYYIPARKRMTVISIAYDPDSGELTIYDNGEMVEL